MLMLQWCAGPIVEDVLPGVLEAHLSPPRWLEKALPVGFVEDGYDSAPAAYRARAGDFLAPQTLDGHGKVVLGDVVRGELVGVVVKNVRRQPCVQKSREVGAVVGVGARFAANHRHSTGGVRARHVIEEVEVNKFCGQRRPSGLLLRRRDRLLIS